MSSPSDPDAVRLRRVVSIIHSATFGGPHNQALTLSKALRERDCELYVLLPEEPGNAPQRLADGGVVVHRMPLVRPRGVMKGAPSLLWRYPLQVLRLARYLRKVRADLVEVHGLQHIDGAAAAKLAGLPVVWQLIDTRPSPLVRRLFMPLVCRLADVIMTTGRAVAHGYPGAISMDDRLVTFVPPVAQNVPRSALERSRIRGLLGISEEAFVIVAVGNLNPQKGHDVLLEAVSVICGENPNLTVLIRGAVQPGHELYAAELQELAARTSPSQISVAALEPWLNISDLLAAGDLFALPSRARSEGIPTVVLEAIASGLPVLASDVGALAEVLAPGVGELIRPNDPIALEDAIRRLIDSPQRLASMAKAAQAIGSEIGSPAEFADRQWLAYQRAAAERLRRRR